MNLENFESVKRWKSALSRRGTGLSKTTWGKYTWCFQKFLDSLRTNPDEIITQRIEDLTSTDFIVRGRFEDSLDKFHNEYSKRSAQTAALIFRAVQSFFKHNRASLMISAPTPPKVREEKFRGGGTGQGWWDKGDYIPATEEIRQMIQNAKPRNAAMFILDAETGMSADTLLNLTWGSVREDLMRGIIPFKIDTYRNKVRRPYVTFACDDAARYLRRAFSNNSLSDETLLFPITLKTFDDAIKRAGAKIGICEPTGISGFRSHTLGRKRVQTILESVHVRIKEGPFDIDGTIPSSWVDILLCHKPPGMTGHYSRPPEHILRAVYEQAAPQLKIFG